MKSTSMLALIIALLAIVSATAVTLSSDDSSAAGEYKISYYGEIEDTVVFDNSYAVTGGGYITLRAAPTNQFSDDYTQIGWLYNGVVYAVGQQFLMPEEDVRLEAVWEDSNTLEAAVELPMDATMIYMIVGAIFAISAIIGVIVIQMMRVKALEAVQ